MNDLYPIALKKLKEYFGFNDFRPKQKEVINQVLNQKDTLALMPTGGGKSICYQIPALVFEGCTVVVSPLIALMKDQVDSLKENGISAAALNSGLTPEEAADTRRAFCKGELKLLYISPERLTFEIAHLLPQGKVSLFAIDEAHCISQWGHDFRPEYTQLFKLREMFPKVPILALTATADAITRKDITNQLSIPAENVILDSFDRKNLSLTVKTNFTKKSKIGEICDFIKERKGESGIIYCLSRKSTETVADELTREGIFAEAYHAGMTAEERATVQDNFLFDRTKVICATIAFGMGIDKSNIRYVIHYNTPKNMEGYYQEIGRAGRDGLPADTLLFYSDSDIVQLAKFTQDIADEKQRNLQIEKLRRIQHYATSLVCRRRLLLSYFGEILSEDCKNCDICKHPPKRFNGTTLTQKALSAIARTKEQENIYTIIDILRGSKKMEITSKGYDKLKTFGVGASTAPEKWNAYIQQMIHLGYITMSYTDKKNLQITNFGKEVLFNQKNVELALVTDEMLAARYSKNKPADRFKKQDSPTYTNDKYIRLSSKEDLEGSDAELFEELRIFRRELAQKANVPPYVIFSDKVLLEMVHLRPTSLMELSNVPGVGAVKLQKYGRGFLEIINGF